MAPLSGTGAVALRRFEGRTRWRETAGHRRPIPDLIIAATAELHQAEVLHVDSDYDLIAEVTGQPVRRLFDPGCGVGT
jgi:predicted nucleic acid-binding protein